MRAPASESDVPHRGFIFGTFVLDIDRAALLHNGKNVRLRPQSLDVLRHLVEHHGRLVSKEDLLDKVWEKTAVSDDSLTHCLIDIRKALGDTERQMIRTVPRRGFIFDLPVESISSAMRQEQQRRRSRIVSAVAATVLVAVGAGYILLNVNRPNTAPPPALAEPHFDQDVIDLQVRGHFLFNRRAPGDLELAEDLLKQAVGLEPEFAAAWADLAGVYVLDYFGDTELNPKALPLLKDAAEKAVALDPDLAAGWVRLAHYYYVTGDQPSADRYMQRAVEAESQDPLLLAVMAGKFAEVGDFERAIQLQEQALAANPLSLVIRFNMSAFLLAAGRYDDALREAEKATQLSPDGTSTAAHVGFALIKVEQYERALVESAGWPDSLDKDVVQAMAALMLNDEAVATEAIERLKSSKDIESYRRLAELEAFCDNIDNSFLYLVQLRDQLHSQMDPKQWRWQLMLVKMSPFLAPVRADPRWQEWLEEADGPLVADSRKVPVRTAVR